MEKFDEMIVDVITDLWRNHKQADCERRNHKQADCERRNHKQADCESIHKQIVEITDFSNSKEELIEQNHYSPNW